MVCCGSTHAVRSNCQVELKLFVEDELLGVSPTARVKPRPSIELRQAAAVQNVGAIERFYVGFFNSPTDSGDSKVILLQLLGINDH